MLVSESHGFKTGILTSCSPLSGTIKEAVQYYTASFTLGVSSVYNIYLKNGYTSCNAEKKDEDQNTNFAYGQLDHKVGI